MWNSQTIVFEGNLQPEHQLTNWLIKNNIKSFVIFEKTDTYVTVVY